METLGIRRNNKEFTRWETDALPFNNLEQCFLRGHGFSPCGDGSNLFFCEGDLQIDLGFNCVDSYSMCHVAKLGDRHYTLYFSDDYSETLWDTEHKDDLDQVLEYAWGWPIRWLNAVM